MQCRLCLREVDLCQSHIIPEFLFRRTYDDKHRASELSLPSLQEKYVQKGYREALLCRDCETILSKYERYVSLRWYENHLLPNQIPGDQLIIKGLDYARFKLFHLSVLWKASISTLNMYSEIGLGPHEENLRTMLLREEPGEEGLYSFMAEVLVSDEENHIIHELVLQPRQTKRLESTICYFVFGGCIWYYMIGRCTSKVFAPYLFSREGKLILRKRRLSDVPLPLRRQGG